MTLLLENSNNFIEDIDSEQDDIELSDIEDDTNKDNWIESYIEKEAAFNKFYKEKINSIKLFFIFIDKNKHIIKLLKDRFVINDNLLKKDEILSMVAQKKNLLKKKFKLIQILQYNFSIDNTNINKFLSNENDEKYLNILHEIDDIYWTDTIPLFHELNSLYFIFHEKSSKYTKKIFLKKAKRAKKAKKAKTKKNKLKEMNICKSNIIKIE